MVNKESTSKQIKMEKTDIAFIPVGSTEQHSVHLPVMTDAFIIEKISYEVAKRIGGYLLPTLPFGTSIENMGGAGTVTLRPMTLRQVIYDLVDSLYRQGYKKIFVINFHGGNFILRPAIREINYERQEGKVFYVGSEFFTSAKKRIDLHAGEIETSLMMYLWRKNVSLDEVKNTTPNFVRSDLDWIGMVEATDGIGSWGYPTRASYNKGKKIFKKMVEDYVNEIKRLLILIEKKKR